MIPTLSPYTRSFIEVVIATRELRNTTDGDVGRTALTWSQSNRPKRRPVSRATRGTTLAAAIWSLSLAGVGFWWIGDARAYPFGPNDPRGLEVGSVFAAATPAVAACLFAVLGFGGAGVAIALLSPRPKVVAAATTLGAGVATFLLLVVPDVRVMQNFAYLFFGHTGLWDRALAFEVYAMLGGSVWTIALFASRPASAGLTSGPGFAGARRVRPLAYLAATLMLPYPIVRLAWALGIPLGIPAEMLDPNDVQTRIGEAGLGAMFVAGAILTTGLARRWGSVVPAWVPWLGGRPIPVWMAVVPAVTAAILLSQAGLRIAVWTLIGEGQLTAESWGMGGPGLFWLPSGVMLGAATYAYYRGRQPAAPRYAKTARIRR